MLRKAAIRLHMLRMRRQPHSVRSVRRERKRASDVQATRHLGAIAATQEGAVWQVAEEMARDGALDRTDAVDEAERRELDLVPFLVEAA